MRILIAGVAFLFSATLWAGDTPGMAELYGALPSGTGVRLSPNGEHLAMIAGTEGLPLLVVWHLDGTKPTVIRTGKEIPRWVAWKSDRQLVAGLYATVADDADRPYEITRMAAFDPDGGHLTHIHPEPRDEASYTMLVTSDQTPEVAPSMTGPPGGAADLNTSSPLMAMGPGLRRTVNPAWAQFQDGLLNMMAGDGEHVLVEAITHPRPAVVDGMVSRDIPGTLSGAAVATSIGGWAGRRVTAREVNAVHWLADAKGDVRLKVEIEGLERRIYARDGGQEADPWRLIQSATLDKQPLFGPALFAPANLDPEHSFVPLAFDAADPNILHVSVLAPSGGLALGRFDLAAGRLAGPLIESAKADVTPLLLGGQLIGWRAGREPAVYFDAALNDRVAAIRKSMPGPEVALVDVSADGKRMLLLIAAEGAAPIYWLYDRRGAQPSLVVALQTYPLLPADPAIAGKWVEIKARDGLTIPALLTLPSGRGSGRIPFVVLPHDGPADHDRGGFQWIVQYLVHIGYGVLQPQFRGSTGFGQAWERAGDREWGWKMQDDVTDATLWLADQGLADKDNICILGQGYGGYAALMGAVREPTLYRCAAALDPLTDLRRFVEDREDRGLYRDINVARIADPNAHHDTAISDVGSGKTGGRDAEIIVTAQKERTLSELERISPFYHAKEIRIPVLLAHARQDYRIPSGQTQKMETALRTAGASVQALYFEDDDQNLRKAADRIAFLNALQGFLKANLLN